MKLAEFVNSNGKYYQLNLNKLITYFIS